MKNLFSTCRSQVAALRRIAALAAAIAGIAPVFGQITIDLPDVTLQPNLGGQTFNVFVSNAGSDRTDITGAVFTIQTADGGPAAGGVIPAPSISNVDIVTGTLFALNSNGNEPNPTGVPQIFEVDVQTTNSISGATTVTIPNGSTKLATVTIDTSGFSSGTYTMTLDTRNGKTRFTTLTTDFVPVLLDGTITVVPEPKSALAVAGCLVAMAGFLRRRRVATGRL